MQDEVFTGLILLRMCDCILTDLDELNIKKYKNMKSWRSYQLNFKITVLNLLTTIQFTLDQTETFEKHCF